MLFQSKRKKLTTMYDYFLIKFITQNNCIITFSYANNNKNDKLRKAFGLNFQN